MKTTARNNSIDLELFSKLKEDVAHIFKKDNIEKVARESGFVQRTSKLTGQLFMTVFVFGMSIYKTPTLEQLIGLINTCIPDFEITRQGFHDRINDNAVVFFEYMLSLAIKITIPSTINIEVLKQFKRVIVMDSTSFQLPEELAVLFPGSGGSASDAGMKIQFGYDLKSSQFFYIMQEGKAQDNSDEMDLPSHIQPEDLFIADLGYFNILNAYKIDQKNAYSLNRLKLNVNLYVMDDNKKLINFDLLKFTDSVVDGIFEIEVYLKHKELLVKQRLVIERAPEQVYEQRLRRINENDKKKGKTTSEKTKKMQAFNLHLSNAPESMLSKEYFRKLYGIRWQIELIFKNC